jgi:DNA-binding XRE family transcriptional regulator
MTFDIITRNGRQFVLLPIEEYERLTADEPPQSPPVEADSASNAIGVGRAVVAQRLIADRLAAGLSQQRLAKLACVRQETIALIESEQQSATLRVIGKLDKAIHLATRRKQRRDAAS